ncbi:MAG: hypothetical protein PHS80_05760 [Methanothrix sp.]|nr:hypothetical protein [Methanothrix sp.]
MTAINALIGCDDLFSDNIKKETAQQKNVRKINVPLVVGPSAMGVSMSLPRIAETANENDVKNLPKDGSLILYIYKME